MVKIYTKNISKFENQPSEQTIKFLLDYSKSLKIIKTKSKSNKFVELNLN